MIKERIQHLRALLAENQMDAYIIPTADFHESEYVEIILRQENICPVSPALQVPWWLP